MHVVTKFDTRPSLIRRLTRSLLFSGIVLSAFVTLCFLAVRVSPWPTSLITRIVFNRGARLAYHKLDRHLPAKIYQLRNQHYDDSDGDAYLDVYSPVPFDGTARPSATVVWIHGGAWLSGNKNDIANYARILAARGFTVVGVDYSLSPARLYPTPVLQVNAALAYLAANADRLHIDPSRIFLAGDSAGAQIAAQLANVITSPGYAAALNIQPSIKTAQLRGVLLYCGVYDIDRARFEGVMGYLMHQAVRAYMGNRDYAQTRNFAEASVLHYITPAFPPTFLTVGDSDPFYRQSHALAEVLDRKGVSVDSLFYAEGHRPPLQHEYQFNLDIPEGQQALDRAVGFIAAH